MERISELLAMKGTSTTEDEVPYRPELWRLIRIRDFISLLLSYPVKLTEEEKDVFKAWTDAFPEWKAQLLSNIDHDVISEEDRPWHVLTKKALRCMKRLIPVQIIYKLQYRQRFEIGKSIFEYYYKYEIPEGIIDLSVDLAIEQLIQALFSGADYASDTRYVKLSIVDDLGTKGYGTKGTIKKEIAVKKIEIALKGKQNLFGVDKEFLTFFWIDASKYKSDAEVRVQQEINTMMEVVKEEMTSNSRYMVILVDRDDTNRKLNPKKVNFPPGIVVLITTETSEKAKGIDEFTIACSTDLNISNDHHLLPWIVLCNLVGQSVVYSSKDIREIAGQIIEECRGHLFAIAIVAKSIKNNKDVTHWRHTLENLRCTNPSVDYQTADGLGISKVMTNAFVNIVWESINERQKLCLELSLFVQKNKIGVPRVTLLYIWVTLLQINEIEQLLADRFVFWPCEKGSYIRMREESYYIIVSLHTSNPSAIKYGALEIIEPSHDGGWHPFIPIELIDNTICKLPESSTRCSKLQVLLLQGNADLMGIPDTFFEHMPLLHHLDLSYTNIRYLPSSISKLGKLKKFYLKGCNLFMELPQNIGELKNLEVLDLEGTLITHLPKEIGELINLQRLILCFDAYCSYGEKGEQISNSTNIIPPGVMSNLVQLNCLSIKVDPEDKRWNENVESILPEIFGLDKLQSVSIHVPEAKLLELIPTWKPLNLTLVVGHHGQRFISHAPPEVEEKFKPLGCTITFVNGEDVPKGVKMNLKRFRALYLDRHMTIKSVSEFQPENLERLHECIVGECNEMETIFNGSDSSDDKLSRLEFLSVYYMKNLTSICEGRMGSAFLGTLKFIALHTCPMLTTIFTLSFVGNLSLLEELVVEDCPKVTTLISHNLTKPDDETRIFLPRLRKILLLYLPKLDSIFNGLRAGESLQEIEFYYCPKLQILSKRELSSSHLKVKGEKRWWDALRWNQGGRGDASPPIFNQINEEAESQPAADNHNYKKCFEILQLESSTKEKECFMDLGLFLEDKRISVLALIDMWSELYELDEDVKQAMNIIQSLANKNLVNLIVERKAAMVDPDLYYGNHFLTQHFLLRELAINGSSQEPIERRERLIVDLRRKKLPEWGIVQKNHHVVARILSLITDETSTSDWCNILPDKAEVLLLSISSKTYTLPEFIVKMSELKVLIITRFFEFTPFGSIKTVLEKFELLDCLPCLKRVRLDNVEVPSLCKLRSLRKLSLYSCSEIEESFEGSSTSIPISDALPNLEELNFESCFYLYELPSELCNITTLKKLRIIDCYSIRKLPEEIEKLENLEVLRLNHSYFLREMPESVGRLRKLHFLEITDCEKLTQLPSSVMNFGDLKHEICVLSDEKGATLWEPFSNMLPNLKLEILKAT